MRSLGKRGKDWKILCVIVFRVVSRVEQVQEGKEMMVFYLINKPVVVQIRNSRFKTTSLLVKIKFIQG